MPGQAPPPARARCLPAARPGSETGMWLFLFVLPLAVILLIGGLLSGGIYTIVFLPIAVIVVVGAVLYTMWGRATEPKNVPGEREQVQPLPHTAHSNTAATPSSPSQLVDAQRREQ
jgi:hypothetical protein